MAEVSLLISARDNYSGNLVKMSQANKRFSKDLDGLEAQLDKLTKNKHQIEVETKDAKKELDALKKEYDKAKAAAKGADDTFKDNTGYTKKLAEYQNMCDNLKLVSKEAASAEKAIRNFDDTQSKSNNRAMGAKESLKALSRAGITQMVGTSISGAANAGISSAFGQEQGSMISSALSGTISGAAMGSVAGIPGAAIGGALGLVSGLIEGKTQAFESRDAAFKEYTNDQYVRLADTNKSMLESGVDYASNQEQLKMSFRTMLGSRALADDTMDSMRSMAASTPFGINDLAGGAQTLLSFGVPWHNLMNTVQMLGDVSQGNVSKFDSLALAFGQVSSAGKLSGQDLLQFINAGFNPLNEIVKVTGESMEELRKRMSDGKVSASEVAQAFETATSQGGMFYDALEKQSMTYSGISSTLKDAEAELAAAMGEGYMTMRMPDMQQQIEFYNGETGEAMKEAYQAIGRYKADLENRQYEYQRDAFEALTGGEISELYKNNGNGEFAEQLGGLQASFKEAVENDDGAKLDSLYAEAQAIAEDAYNADTKVQDNLQKQIDLLEQIKDYAALLPDSWESVYRMGQAESRGQLATARGKNEALDVTMTAGESIGDIALK